MQYSHKAELSRSWLSGAFSWAPTLPRGHLLPILHGLLTSPICHVTVTFLWPLNYTTNRGEGSQNGSNICLDISCLLEKLVFAFIKRNWNQIWHTITEIQTAIIERKYHTDIVLSFSNIFMYFNILELENPEAFLLCLQPESAWPGSWQWPGYKSRSVATRQSRQKPLSTGSYCSIAFQNDA